MLMLPPLSTLKLVLTSSKPSNTTDPLNLALRLIELGVPEPLKLTEPATP